MGIAPVSEMGTAMSEFWAVRKGDALYPAEAESAVVFSRLPLGKALKIDAKQQRNGNHHRLFWVFCTRIANALGIEAEAVSDHLKVETGHCYTIKTRKGWVKYPKSISYAKMDQTEFGNFFDRCIVLVCEEWGMQRADVLDAVKDIVDGSLPWNRAAA